MWQGVRVGPAVLGVAVGNDPADTFDRRRGSCRRRRGFTGGLPGRVPPAAAASLGSRGVSSHRDAVTSEMVGL